MRGGRLFLLTLLPQKLLEECEQNWGKVEESHRLAKQYIDAIKVRGSELGLLKGRALQAAPPPSPGSGGSHSSQPLFPLKDYELQLVTYKAQVEPVSSPAKKPKVQSASDNIIQEVRRRPWAGLVVGAGRRDRGSRRKAFSYHPSPVGRKALLGALGQSWGLVLGWQQQQLPLR